MSTAPRDAIGFGLEEIERLRERFRGDPSPSRLLRFVIETHPDIHSGELHLLLEDIFCLRYTQSHYFAGWYWWEPTPSPPMTDERFDQLLLVGIEATRSEWDRSSEDP